MSNKNRRNGMRAIGIIMDMGKDSQIADILFIRQKELIARGYSEPQRVPATCAIKMLRKDMFSDQFENVRLNEENELVGTECLLSDLPTFNRKMEPVENGDSVSCVYAKKAKGGGASEFGCVGSNGSLYMFSVQEFYELVEANRVTNLVLVKDANGSKHLKVKFWDKPDLRQYI